MELTIDQALQQGVAAHKEGKLQEAERLYRAILQTQPTHPDANHNLGVIAVSVNKAGAALPLFKTALEANPKVEQFWLSYMDALIKENQLETVKKVLAEGKKMGLVGEKVDAFEEQLKQIAQSAPSKLSKKKKSLTLREKRKKISKSKQQKKKGESKNPNSANPSQSQLNNLIEQYQNGQYDEAEKLAVLITQQFPEHQLGWKVLGAVLKGTGRVSEALVAIQKSVALAPEDAEAHSNLGITLRDLGRLEEAEASLRQALALKPDLAEAHSNLGNTLQELGRLKDAEASHRKAIALKPDYADAHSNLGGTLLKQTGRVSEALVAFQKSVALAPEDAKAHSNLGITLQELGKLEDALVQYKKSFELVRGKNPVDPQHESFRLISKAKMKHDIEQFEYLAASGYESEKFQALVNVYKAVSSEINWPTNDAEIIPLTEKYQRLLMDTYNRSIHVLEAPELPGLVLSNTLDIEKITENYFKHDFGLTYFDNFLTPVALDSIRHFLLGSTIWFDFFHEGGYIGAYLKDGMACPLFLQIAEEMRTTFPKIFKNHPLKQLWAYKYDSRAYKNDSPLTGIGAHADFAAVNVNFWVTPKAANLNSLSGGLVVYNTEAPLEWGFRTFNYDTEKMLEHLEDNNDEKSIVPYNENRIVIFNSNLIHETDKFEFKEGYENRRINVTMLFGEREA